MKVVLITILVAVLSSCKPKPAGEVAKTIFENEYARVLRVSLQSNEKQPEHEGKIRLIYSLNDYVIEGKEGGESIGKKGFKKGNVHFHREGIHYAHNLGSKEANWLIFERKNENLPSCGQNSTEKDVTSMPGDFAVVLFENNYFKAMKVTLEPGTEIPEHSGVNRIVYSLNDYKISYQSDKLEQVEKTFKTGDIHWHGACMHSLKNTGDKTVEYLVVVYKKVK